VKQCISVKQLEQLTNEQQIKVATLAGEYGNCCNTGGETMNLGKLSDKLTIGKMIEILSDNGITEISPVWDNDGNITGWSVDICDPDKGGWFVQTELCDCLWEAVKKCGIS